MEDLTQTEEYQEYIDSLQKLSEAVATLQDVKDAFTYLTGVGEEFKEVIHKMERIAEERGTKL